MLRAKQAAAGSSVIIFLDIGATVEPVFDGKRVNHVENVSILDVGIAEREQGGADQPLAGCLGTTLKDIVVQFGIRQALVGSLDKGIIYFPDLLFRHLGFLLYRSL
jgi:hypothetical protein